MDNSERNLFAVFFRSDICLEFNLKCYQCDWKLSQNSSLIREKKLNVLRVNEKVGSNKDFRSPWFVVNGESINNSNMTLWLNCYYCSEFKRWCTIVISQNSQLASSGQFQFHYAVLDLSVREGAE